MWKVGCPHVSSGRQEKFTSHMEPPVSSFAARLVSGWTLRVIWGFFGTFDFFSFWELTTKETVARVDNRLNPTNASW